VRTIKSVNRLSLDQRLVGLDAQIGLRPASGWIRTLRDALGMSAFELGLRMGVTQPRASQIERAEVHGSITLSTLERAAEALNCRLHYVLVPDEPLDRMVRRQARAQAAAQLAAASPSRPSDDHAAVDSELIGLQVDLLAHDLVDTRGLWRPVRPERAK
jgi:predicted DNA-binding mobile mystery protein A